MAEIGRIVVNGTAHAVATDSGRSLLHVLREDLDLTGAKFGCGEGSCGACTVLVDGKPVRSCITPVGSLDGKPVDTVEGLAQGDRLHPVQQAFLDADALQCGYCTSGMVLACVALLRRTPRPTEEQAVAALQGNVCRCGTQRRILRAVRLAAERAAR